MRTYECVACGHAQQHDPSEFSAGRAPLCRECRGVLRRAKGLKLPEKRDAMITRAVEADDGACTTVRSTRQYAPPQNGEPCPWGEL